MEGFSGGTVGSLICFNASEIFYVKKKQFTSYVTFCMNLKCDIFCIFLQNGNIKSELEH